MRRAFWLLLIIFVLSAVAACSSGPSEGFAQVSGKVTYAKSADQPLTDASNVGAAATDVKVRIRVLQQPKNSAGQPIFMPGDPLFDLTPDAKGAYQVELAQAQYLLEIVGQDNAVLDKRMLTVKAGQKLQADFNLKPAD